MTTANVPISRWYLFQDKIKRDKAIYFKITKKKVRLSPPIVINAFMWGILNNRFQVDLTFGSIKDANSMVGISIDKDIRKEMKKYIIDYESNNFVPHPTGLSGVISRIVEHYLRLDFREVMSKILEWEKQTKGVK